MKKSLVALAVLGAFSGAAFAQSNVTLYGIVDVNYQYNNPKGSSTCYSDPYRLTPNGIAMNAGGGATSTALGAPSLGASLSTITAPCSTTSGINGGHQSGNRWGIRGSEALGGGLNAIFTLESGFAIDTGTSSQGGRLFGRQAWAGLQGNWGAVVAGRIAALSSGTGSFDMWGQVDPFSTGFGDSGLQSTMSSSNSIRVDNAIAYVSPTWSGFKGGIAYSFNVSGAEAPGGGNNTRLLDMGLSWTWGNLYLVTTYDIVYLPNCTGGTTSSTSSTICGGADQTHWQIGGTYDFKFVKLHAAYAMEKNQRAFSTVGTLPNIQDGFDSNSWMLGVTVPLFGGQVLASYQQRDGDERSLNALQKFEADLSVWAIAYTYPLSRRTNLYINYSDKSGEKSLANTSTLSSGLGGDRSQFTLGMRHLF